MEPPSSQSLVVWKYANLRIDRKQEKVVQIPLASLSLYIHQHIGLEAFDFKFLLQTLYFFFFFGQEI